ncbi:MAG: hypothetical protein J5833_00315, partial [Victivallales bacterium]|nr:hypothetical protein [Victivallales bacterium]
MKRTCLLFALSLICLFAEENLLKNGTASGGIAPMQGMEVVTSTDGRKCFEVKPSGKVLVGGDLIEVDADARYLLSVELMSGAGEAGKLSFGLIPYNINRQLTSYSSVAYAEGSDAVLAEDAERGATVLVFDGVKDWQSLQKRYYRVIAMNAKNDFSDLPNRELCYSITAMEQEGGRTRVTLNHPIQKAYKAGTKCRLHRDGGYQWSIMENGKVPTVWKSYSATISGMSTRGVPLNQFWKDTKYVRIVIQYNGGTAPILLDKVSFTRQEEVPDGMVAAVKSLVPEEGATLLATSCEIIPPSEQLQGADGTVVIEAEQPWRIAEAKGGTPCIVGEDGCGAGAY